MVLGSDRKHYRVLDMDFKKLGSKGQGEGGESGEESDGSGDGEDVEMSGA